MYQNINSVEQLLDCIEKIGPDEERISMNAILEAVGTQSLGPSFLIAGLITLAPLIGDIPGVPTIMGIFVFLTAGQLLLFRENLWFPKWLLNRSISRDKLHKALKWLHRPGRFIDRLLKPRLTIFVQGAGIFFIGVACTIVALVMPLMEFIPFSANIAGVALTAFGLSLITRDGFLALLALLFTFSSIGVVVFNIF
ncbi:MAG: exopolysaccharide biosynthesis protein [Balneolales bacterium]